MLHGWKLAQLHEASLWRGYSKSLVQSHYEKRQEACHQAGAKSSYKCWDCLSPPLIWGRCKASFQTLVFWFAVQQTLQSWHGTGRATVSMIPEGEESDFESSEVASENPFCERSAIDLAHRLASEPHSKGEKPSFTVLRSSTNLGSTGFQRFTFVANSCLALWEDTEICQHIFLCMQLHYASNT